MDQRSSSPVFIDSHCHLPLLKESVDNILEKCAESGIDHILNVGYDQVSSEQSLALTKNRIVSASVGIHPHYVAGDLQTDMLWLRKICLNSAVHAIGEIGLDYVKSSTSKECQMRWLEEQLNIAEEYNLPVIIHNRSADLDIENILSHHPRIKGVLHCFSSDIEFGNKMLNMGWFLSFSGNITYAKSGILRQMVKECPINRMLLETDAPYLTPMPYRGRKENSPLMMPEIYRFVCEIRKEELLSLAQNIVSNFELLFLKRGTK
jgi:TatD DNase family protein